MKIKIILLFLLNFALHTFAQQKINPSFEFVIENTNIPLYWKNNADGASSFTFFADSTVQTHGKRSLSIQGKELMQQNVEWYNEKGGMAYLYVHHALNGKKNIKKETIKCTIEFNYKLQGNQGVYSLVGLTKVHNGENHTFSNDTLRATTGKWQKKVIQLDLNVKDAWEYLTLLFNGVGQVWFDELKISIDGAILQTAPPRTPSAKDIQFVNKNLIAISSTKFDASDNGVTNVIASLPEFKVIALGESTHGTSEFHSLRANVIKNLILQKRVNFVVLETNFSDSFVALNRYVIDGEGTAVEALKHTLVWPWQTQEMQELLEWIKTYNQTTNEKVYLGGMDVQFNYITSNYIAKKLRNIDSTLTQPIQTALNFLNKKSPYTYFEWANKKDSIAIFEQYALQVKTYLSSIKDKIAKVKGTFQADLLLQFAENMCYFAKMMNSYGREELSAQNIQWILQSIPNAKIAVIAHTAHTASNRSQNGTGYFLKQKLGKNYISICFTTAFGKYTAFDGTTNQYNTQAALIPPTFESLEYLLSKAKHPNFYLPINKKFGMPNFFKFDMHSLGLGSIVTPNQTYVISAKNTNIYEHFDGIFFIKETTGTNLLLKK